LTTTKWRKREFAHDAAMAPKDVRSSVLTLEEEAAIVAFRRYTLLMIAGMPCNRILRS